MMLSLKPAARLPLASLEIVSYIIPTASQTGHGRFSTVTQ